MKCLKTILLLAACHFATAFAGDLTIWHAHPAKNWNEATPVGNGRLGAMIFGGVKTERIQLNEDSLWSGAPQDADNPKAFEVLPEIRQMLFDGKYAHAQKLANRTLICKGPGSGRGRGGKIAYGSYETQGDLLLAFNHGRNEPVNYRRELDLDNAVAKVSYEVNGVRFERELFSSFPDQVLVVRLKTSKAGALNFNVVLSRTEAAQTVVVGKDQLLLRGQLWNGVTNAGMKFAARLGVVCSTGKVLPDGDNLRIENATEVTLLLTAATDYRLQLPDWRHGDPEKQTEAQLAAAMMKPYARLRAAHVADYEKLFGRVTLELNGVNRTDAADERLKAVAAGVSDLDLVRLYF